MVTAMSEDITILTGICGINWRLPQSSRSRVYYYKGNIFRTMFPDGGEVSRIRRAIKAFLRENEVMVRRDRADPSYKTLTELFEVSDE